MRPGKSLGVVTKARREHESGTAIVEFGLVILPAMGFLFLLMNVAWIIFGWACVQEAVREGVRAAVTCSPTTGLNAAVDQVVEQYSFGFINAQNAPSYVSVNYYSPTTLAPVSGLVTTGTVVKVSVNGLPLNTFAAILHSAIPIHLSATSADLMACSTPATP